VATLRDHFDRHGGDFRATSPEDYAAQAWRFLQDAKAAGWPAKLDAEGTLRVWDPRTRAFAAYTRQGMTKTYFKPGSHDYFERQPGRPIRLKADIVSDRP
jgi:pyocin large subunit-like protein